MMTPRETIALIEDNQGLRFGLGDADNILDALAAAGFVVMPNAEIERLKAERNISSEAFNAACIEIERLKVLLEREQDKP